MSTSVAGLSTNFFPSAENGFTSTTSGSVASAATTVGLNSVAGYTNGEVVVFVIDPTDATKKQTFTGVMDTAGSQVTSVVWTAGTNQTHALGATVVDYATATHISMMTKGITQSLNQDGTLITQAVRDALNLDSGSSDGWTPFGYSLTSITALGNRSYTAVVSGTDTTGVTSVGQRLKLPRTVTAPTQCTDLESGSSQYWTKATPTGTPTSFTDDWSAMAWIKLESYTGSRQIIINRSDYTNQGFGLAIDSSGRLEAASFRIAANNSVTTSYQSVPLNKWVHVAVTSDLSGASVLTYIDGVLVPSLTTISGTITALVQYSGDLRIGALSSAASQYFDGKIAQVGLFSSTVLSAATIRSYMGQTLTGSETNCIGAWSFNGVATDLTATANNMSASGSAGYVTTDTPFTNPVTGTSVTAGTTNYGIIMAQTFSTNTTYTIQIPEGETLPTTGGIGTVSYSTQKTPYGFPGAKTKWEMLAIFYNMSSTYGAGIAQIGSAQISVPAGNWNVGVRATIVATSNPVSTLFIGLSNTPTANEDLNYLTYFNTQVATIGYMHPWHMSKNVDLSSATNYYIQRTGNANMTSVQWQYGHMFAECNYL